MERSALDMRTWLYAYYAVKSYQSDDIALAVGGVSPTLHRVILQLEGVYQRRLPLSWASLTIFRHGLSGQVSRMALLPHYTHQYNGQPVKLYLLRNSARDRVGASATGHPNGKKHSTNLFMHGFTPTSHTMLPKYGN